jgi:GPH family glycoside/pentoside/hexuronide:cation symporter
MQKLSRREKWIYGSGDLGISLTLTIISAYFAIFLTDVVGIRASVGAIAIAIGLHWDYINDLFIGHISDRTRTRWGRRRPYLLFGALPFALFFTLMWWLPPIANRIALVVYYAVLYVLFEAAATVVYMPYMALTPELTQDYDERTSISTIRMFFSIVGSLVAFTIPMMIVDGFRPEHAGRVLIMGLSFAIVSAIPLILVFLGTRERLEFMQQEQPSLRQSIRAVRGNRPFFFGLGIYLFTWISFSILQVMLLYFIKYVVQREAQSDLIMATIFVVAILALPFWERVSRRLNKRLAYIIGISFWAVVQLFLVSLTPSSSLGPLLFMCVLAGIGVGAAHILPWSIMPDAIEWGEWHTGERHEGVFYSLITLLQKIASSIAVPLALLVLDFTGYVPNSTIQPDSVVTGIRILTGPVPAAMLCLGILFASLYPLGRENYTQLARELEARRMAKSKETS